MSGIGSLIVLNVRRNFARSMLTIVGMGIAALVMTASLTLSEGYPATAFGAYRDYCGGDVLVFADKPWVRASDVSLAETGSWEYRLTSRDLPGPWRFFLPGLATRGGIHPQGASPVFLGAGLAAIESALAAEAGIESVRSYFTVPAVSARFSEIRDRGPAIPPSIIEHTWRDSYLRAWRGGSWRDLDGYITAGRSLTGRDEGAFVCLVDVDRARLAALDPSFPATVPAIGDVIEVEVPLLRIDAQGAVLLDYGATRTYEFEVVGHYSVQTREVSWTDPQAGGDSGAPPAEVEKLYLTSPEILVPWQTASQVVSEASGGMADVLSSAIALGVDSLARVEAVVASVGASYPELSVVSVPRLASLANANWLPEPVYRVPKTEWSRGAPLAQMGEPVEISLAFNMIFFAIAALLAAANGIVLVLERQREIGILKAVGAYTRDVIAMILGEVVLLATIGALVGFALAESVAVWNLISNRAGLVSILTTVGIDLIKVLGLTVSFAVVFGLAPALRTTAMTAMEVLRKE